MRTIDRLTVVLTKTEIRLRLVRQLVQCTFKNIFSSYSYLLLCLLAKLWRSFLLIRGKWTTGYGIVIAAGANKESRRVKVCIFLYT